jgi:hypothetical protein
MKFKVDCPSCGGYPDTDESGLPYTCFACCNTGYVWIEESYPERKTRELNEAYEEYAGVK